MARFSGYLGYASQVETAVDVWVDGIIEKKYFGNIVKDAKRWYVGSEITDTIKVVNKVSIVADAYANSYFYNIRYVKFAGSYVKVTDINIDPPRLILTLGGVYNGPTASGA